MRYTLLLHFPEMTAAELGEEALKEGMAAFGGVRESARRRRRAAVR